MKTTLYSNTSRLGRIAVLALLLAAAATTARALTYTEPPDLTSNLAIPAILGPVSPGVNTISGSLNATYDGSGPVANGDDADSFQFTVPAGQVVTSVTLTITNFAASPVSTHSARVRTFSGGTDTQFFGANTTFPNLVITPGGLQAGNHDLQVHGIAPGGGGGSFVAGSLSFNWVFTITSVPTNADLNTGDAVLNVPGATIKTLYPSDVDPDGNLVAHAKLAGAGITGANDESIVRWDHATGLVTALVRKGDALAGGTIAKLGDPVLNQTSALMAFTATLAQTGGVTAANDTLLCVAGANAPGGVTAVMREGAPAPGVGTRTLVKFSYVYWAGDALFIGGSATAPAANPKSLAGVWAYTDSLTATVFPGDPITVDGVATTVTAVSLPNAKKPATAEARVGNADSLSLLIKTADKKQVIKHYPAPPFSS